MSKPSEHVSLHEAGSLPARARELLSAYEFPAQGCGDRNVLKLTLDEAMGLLAGALETRDEQWRSRGKALRYVAFVLTRDESAEVELAVDRAKGKIEELELKCIAADVAKAELKKYKIEVEAILMAIPASYRVHVREGGGPENVLASLAVSVASLIQLLTTQRKVEET